ncbi:hypothetical protein MTO96_017898 [Rhipicephalus appendiculatus]
MEIEARDPRTGAVDRTKQKRAETNAQWRSPDATLWRSPPTTVVRPRFVDRATDGVRGRVADWTEKHHVQVSSPRRAPLAPALRRRISFHSSCSLFVGSNRSSMKLWVDLGDAHSVFSYKL